MGRAFDLVANGYRPSDYPQRSVETAVRTVPPSLLKAVGWIESGWQQFTPAHRPLVSFDFGYGIMQVTSGMAGAFGSARGNLDPVQQSRIASDYLYNIAYGAEILMRKWLSTPQVGMGDATAIEDWYYALWAYNGWGWVNNPNNPRFTRAGTPATNANSFPYQERVLYFVAHPPRTSNGTYLWPPVHVSLPARSSISQRPGPLTLRHVHQQAPSVLNAEYSVSPLPVLRAGSIAITRVRISNTGTGAWAPTGNTAMSLTYHILSAGAGASGPLTPFSPGMVAFGQGALPLPSSILPGQSVVIAMTVTAPAKPGKYLLAWDLEQGSELWLSQIGVVPRIESLRVISTAAPLPATPTPTPRPPEKATDLEYLADTSFPDGTAVASGQPFLKGWLVFNDGTRGWGPAWNLRHVSGHAFGVNKISIPSTSPCSSAILVAGLRAPRRATSYTSVWQLADPSGHRAGEKLTLVIVVRGHTPPGTPIPTPTLTPAPPAPRATPTATPSG